MREYVLNVGGVEHTVQMSEAEAKRRGLVESNPRGRRVKSKARRSVPNKEG